MMGVSRSAMMDLPYGFSEVNRISAPQDQDDVALLMRVAHRDEQALDILYARHAPGLLGYLFNLLGDRSEAEEILQDTFFAVWKSAGRFQGRSRVRTWLFGIAHRQARDRHRRHSLTVDPDVDLTEVADSAQGPEDFVLERAERDQLVALLAKLRPHQHEILVLAFAYELSYLEIAQVLDIPIGTVKSRMNHARLALRALAQGGEEVTR